jgi:hypothetical protein
MASRVWISPSWTGHALSRTVEFAQATGMRLLFQWRHGGFHREMLKHNAMIAPVSFEHRRRDRHGGRRRGKVGTRRLFPR